MKPFDLKAAMNGEPVCTTKTATWYIVSFLNGTEFGVHPTNDKRKAESLAEEYRTNKYTNVEITEKVVEL